MDIGKLAHSGQREGFKALTERIEKLERKLAGKDPRSKIDPRVLDQGKLQKLLSGSVYELDSDSIGRGAIGASRMGAAAFPSLVQIGVTGHEDFVVNVGPWTNGLSAGNQNDEIGFDILLGQGTYNVELSLSIGSAFGIYTVRSNDTTIFTFDGYDPVDSILLDVFGTLEAPDNGTYRFTVKMEDKNAASSDYVGGIGAIQLRRT